MRKKEWGKNKRKDVQKKKLIDVPCENDIKMLLKNMPNQIMYILLTDDDEVGIFYQ